MPYIWLWLRCRSWSRLRCRSWCRGRGWCRRGCRSWRVIAAARTTWIARLRCRCITTISTTSIVVYRSLYRTSVTVIAVICVFLRLIGRGRCRLGSGCRCCGGRCRGCCGSLCCARWYGCLLCLLCIHCDTLIWIFLVVYDNSGCDTPSCNNCQCSSGNNNFLLRCSTPDPFYILFEIHNKKNLSYKTCDITEYSISVII